MVGRDSEDQNILRNGKVSYLIASLSKTATDLKMLSEFVH